MIHIFLTYHKITEVFQNIKKVYIMLNILDLDQF